MVDKLEIGPHARSIHRYLIGQRAVWTEGSHKTHFFSPKIHIFLHACATCFELQSNMFLISFLINVYS